MAVVFIGTGGDPGHAPARSLYKSLGYRLLPAAQYFRVLPDLNEVPALPRAGPDVPQVRGLLACWHDPVTPKPGPVAWSPTHRVDH